MSPGSPAPRRSPLIPAVIAVLALTVAGIMFGLSRQGGGIADIGDVGEQPSAIGSTPAGTSPDGPATGSSQQAAARSLASSLSDELGRRQDGDPLARGRVEAPVLMIMFSEFQCPFCGKYARDIDPQLRRYVDDGTLRIEWRDFPYLGKESTAVAVAARAAARQDRFWAFHDAWFADQPPPNTGKATPAYLEQVATRAGLDAARFRTDLADPQLAAAVQADVDQAQRLGIGGTPAFLINGSVIMGAQPVEEFLKAIELEAQVARGQ